VRDKVSEITDLNLQRLLFAPQPLHFGANAVHGFRQLNLKLFQNALDSRRHNDLILQTAHQFFL